MINTENDRKISNTYGEKIFHLCQASGSGNGEVITKQYTTGHDARERNGKRVPQMCERYRERRGLQRRRQASGATMCYDLNLQAAMKS